MEEIWKPINGYEGLYSVSNFGRVIRHGVADSKGVIRKERICKPQVDGCGYFRVRIYKNGVAKTNKLHRLVAKEFLLNPENKATVNHKDGNKGNNHVSNLEWMTQYENSMHYLSDKNRVVILKGEEHGCAKLTEKDVRAIRFIKKSSFKISYVELSKIYKVDPALIRKIVIRDIWKHVA